MLRFRSEKTSRQFRPYALALMATSALLISESSFAKKSAPRAAKADLLSPSGEKLGTATLIETKKGVQISVEAKNLAPGPHGFHFHEKGDCQGPDFKSAGSHFNPKDKHHGLDNPKGAHAGDLPNLVANAEGQVKTEFSDPRITLKKGVPNSLFHPGGTSLVIHDQADDEMTDPAGKSGGRIACGVVKPVEAGKLTASR